MNSEWVEKGCLSKDSSILIAKEKGDVILVRERLKRSSRRLEHMCRHRAGVSGVQKQYRGERINKLVKILEKTS